MGLNLHNKNLDFLFKAVLALENVEECYDCLLYTSDAADD